MDKLYIFHSLFSGICNVTMGGSTEFIAIIVIVAVLILALMFVCFRCWRGLSKWADRNGTGKREALSNRLHNSFRRSLRRMETLRSSIGKRTNYRSNDRTAVISDTNSSCSQYINATFVRSSSDNSNEPPNYEDIKDEIRLRPDLNAVYLENRQPSVLNPHTRQEYKTRSPKVPRPAPLGRSSSLNGILEAERPNHMYLSQNMHSTTVPNNGVSESRHDSMNARTKTSKTSPRYDDNSTTHSSNMSEFEKLSPYQKYYNERYGINGSHQLTLQSSPPHSPSYNSMLDKISPKHHSTPESQIKFSGIGPKYSGNESSLSNLNSGGSFLNRPSAFKPTGSRYSSQQVLPEVSTSFRRDANDPPRDLQDAVERSRSERKMRDRSGSRSPKKRTSSGAQLESYDKYMGSVQGQKETYNERYIGSVRGHKISKLRRAQSQEQLSENKIDAKSNVAVRTFSDRRQEGFNYNDSHFNGQISGSRSQPNVCDFKAKSESLFRPIQNEPPTHGYVNQPASKRENFVPAGTKRDSIAQNINHKVPSDKPNQNICLTETPPLPPRLYRELDHNQNQRYSDGQKKHLQEENKKDYLHHNSTNSKKSNSSKSNSVIYCEKCHQRFCHCHSTQSDVKQNQQERYNANMRYNKRYPDKDTTIYDDRRIHETPISQNITSPRKRLNFDEDQQNHVNNQHYVPPKSICDTVSTSNTYPNSHTTVPATHLQLSHSRQNHTSHQYNHASQHQPTQHNHLSQSQLNHRPSQLNHRPSQLNHTPSQLSHTPSQYSHTPSRHNNATHHHSQSKPNSFYYKDEDSAPDSTPIRIKGGVFAPYENISKKVNGYSSHQQYNESFI